MGDLRSSNNFFLVEVILKLLRKITTARVIFWNFYPKR